MLGAGPGEHRAHGSMGEFRAIAIAAEMAKVQVPQLGGNDLSGELGSGFVGEVAVPAKNALFGAPGPPQIVLQQFHIVIGLQDEGVRGPNPFDDQAGGMPQIRQKPDVSGGCAEKEPDRVIGIVRDGEGFDQDIADVKSAAGAEDAEIQGLPELQLDGLFGEAIAVDGDAQFAGEHAQTLNVIGVLMCNQNST